MEAIRKRLPGKRKTRKRRAIGSSVPEQKTDPTEKFCASGHENKTREKGEIQEKGTGATSGGRSDEKQGKRKKKKGDKKGLLGALIHYLY